MNTYFKTASLFVFACVVSACEAGQKNVSVFNRPVIDLPFKKEIVRYADYTFKPSDGGIFTTERGTRLTFPKNAFTYEDGTPVGDPVTIKFREYHSASEILLSGIMMTAKDKNGEEYPFESGGMFDIDGFCGTKKIKVAEGKSIQIDLASMKQDADFNFYKLNDQGWTELEENVPAEENTIRTELQETAIAELPPLPVEPDKFEKDQFVFDIDIDTHKNPELKELYGLMWQYNGRKGDKNDPETNPEIIQKQWSKSYLHRNPDGNFSLSLTHKKESISIPVKPVMSGKNYEAAQKRFEQKMANYDAALKRKEETQKKLERAFEFSRSLSVSGFGIYNIDRFYKMPSNTANPEYLTQQGKLPEGTIIYMIAKEDIVIRLYDNSPMKYSPVENNKLIAIFPDESIQVVNKADFKYSAQNKNHKFTFKEINIPYVNAETLGDVIKSI